MGWPSVEWGLRNISSRELAEWLAFFQVEGPHGAQRDDWHAGLIAATIANMHRDPKRKRQPYKPEDFMPKERREADPMTLLQRVELLNQLFGGTDRRER